MDSFGASEEEEEDRWKERKKAERELRVGPCLGDN